MSYQDKDEVLDEALTVDPAYRCRIRDNVHGTILFSELEKKIIDHPLFQRLRNIRQLAFVRYVFHTATHSRFEHSIGAMHIVDRAFRKMLENQEGLLAAFRRLSGAQLDMTRPTYGDIASTARVFGEMLTEKEGLRRGLRLAMLLHDVGHGPFSHSSEAWYPRLSEVAEKNEGLLTPALKRLVERKLRDLGPKAAATHEDYSLFIMCRIARDIPEFRAEILEDVLAILGSVPSVDEKPSVRERIMRLLHDLVSNEIDADRMDYLIRDSRQCGVSYGEFDHDRLLDSFAFYNRETPSGLIPTLAIKYSGLQAFEDYLLSRYQMYSQVYFHKTSVAMDAMMNYLGEHLPLKLPASVDRYCAICDSEFPELVEKAIERVKERLLRQRLSRVFMGLFKLRDPWRRIFEVNLSMERVGESSDSDRAIVAEEVLRFCREHNVAYQVVEAEKWFTRLLPRGHRSVGDNRLKLIKKNVHGIPFVLPIENYSPIIDTFMRRINILRVYVESRYKNRILLRLDKRFQALRGCVMEKITIGGIGREMEKHVEI